jgi:hypothetical protein
MAKQPKQPFDKQLEKLTADSDDMSLTPPSTLGEEEEEDSGGEEPLYRMMANNRIPVSKKTGLLWKSRRNAAYAKVRNGGDLDRWDEAYRYYRNDHVNNRDRRTNYGADEAADGGVRITTRGLETENIVFANVTSLVPAVYAKNPTIEISMDNPEYDDFGRVAEKLVNAVMRMKSEPGVNLKPKARRAVINCTLTNEAWLEVGYNTKEDSSDAAMQQLEKVAIQLAKAKDQKRIKELEGQLEAMEEKVDLLSPSSPFVCSLAPHMVLVDTDATMKGEERWQMYGKFVSCSMLKALYGKPNEKGEYESIFEPTHVLKLEDSGGIDGDAEDIFSFHKFDSSVTYKDYGFENDETYRKAQRVKVWYVWDKVTRRVYLFNDGDWKWPLWVWDDPYGYPDFFPLVRLNFYDDPLEYYARSETMMYLDQQDGINDINNEVAKNRSYITGKVIYNKNIIKDDSIVDEFLAGTNSKKSLGIDVPPDVDLTKLFAPFTPQSAHLLQTVIFDKSKLLEAIDRVSSVTNVMRGVEYKTNTTNKAIESYESTTQTRLDEKIDAIEDCIGEVGYKILHLCLRFMDDKTVSDILGAEHAQVWTQYRQGFVEGGVKFTATVAGGSTLKPTSATKKQQAIQIGQVLGQFAGNAPVAIITALRVMERAFDEVVIRAEDWQMIIDSIMMQLQRGNSQPQQGGGPQPGAQQAQPGAPGAPSGAEGAQGADLGKVEQLIDSFPPEAKQFLAKLLANDTPIRAAVGEVVKELQRAQGGVQ